MFMDNKDKEQDISNSELNKENRQNDYKFLVHKLKSIKEIINMLEKHFLEKEI